jgi:uncharacterized OsmC-like protein
MGTHYASCSWTSLSGYQAKTPYGEIKMFGEGGHRAVELLLLAAASCLDFYLAEYVRERKLPVSQLHVTCEGEISQHPERVSTIKTTIKIDGELSDREVKKMVTMCERACKVMNTFKHQPQLHVSIESLSTAPSRQ